MTQPVTPQAAIDRFLSRFETPSRLLVAVSGGSDSLGLLLLLHAALETGRFPGFSLCAGTVDHGLREESAGEAVTVARLCGALGIPHRIAVWQGIKPATGLAQAAREARYELLCGMADAFHADAILSAHTLDDQIETVMMRAARNGMNDGRGLAGMAPAVLLQGRYWLLRPLLDCRREDIRDLLRASGTPWADDPSNSNTDYERPRLRARLLSGETPTDPDCIEAVQHHRMTICERAAAFVRDAATVHGGAAIAVSRRAIDAMDDDAVLSSTLAHLAAVTGGRAHPLSRERMPPVIDLCRRGENARLNAGRVLFDLRREQLFLTRERRDISSLLLAPGDQAVWDGRYRIANDGGEPVTIIAAGARAQARAAEWFAALPPGVAKTAAATLPLCVCGDGSAVVLPHEAPPGLRIERFLAPFDRFLPWFDVILARQIASDFGLERYGLPFHAHMRENEG